MAQFLVRNLEDDVHQRLREMAQNQGQSLEEFVREVLRTAALKRGSTSSKLGSKIAKRFAKIGLEQPIDELRGQTMSPLDFE